MNRMIKKRQKTNKEKAKIKYKQNLMEKAK